MKRLEVSRDVPTPSPWIGMGRPGQADSPGSAAEAGVGVSAWMTTAARRGLLIEDGLAALEEWEREHGPFSESELESARPRGADELGIRRRGRSR